MKSEAYLRVPRHEVSLWYLKAGERTPKREYERTIVAKVVHGKAILRTFRDEILVEDMGRRFVLPHGTIFDFEGVDDATILVCMSGARKGVVEHDGYKRKASLLLHRIDGQGPPRTKSLRGKERSTPFQ